MPQSGFPCPICFVKFDKPASLGQHILSSHSEENNDDQQEERIDELQVTPGEQDASGMIIDTVFPDAFSIWKFERSLFVRFEKNVGFIHFFPTSNGKLKSLHFIFQNLEN